MAALSEQYILPISICEAFRMEGKGASSGLLLPSPVSKILVLKGLINSGPSNKSSSLYGLLYAVISIVPDHGLCIPL